MTRGSAFVVQRGRPAIHLRLPNGHNSGTTSLHEPYVELNGRPQVAIHTFCIYYVSPGNLIPEWRPHNTQRIYMFKCVGTLICFCFSSFYHQSASLAVAELFATAPSAVTNMIPFWAKANGRE